MPEAITRLRVRAGGFVDCANWRVAMLESAPSSKIARGDRIAGSGSFGRLLSRGVGADAFSSCRRFVAARQFFDGPVDLPGEAVARRVSRSPLERANP